MASTCWRPRAVILVNIGHVPDAFAEIVAGAVGGNALAGGLIGTLIIGMQRATFSNEAGVGSAAIAALCGKNQRTGYRRVCSFARTLHRYGGRMYHDGPGDCHIRPVTRARADGITLTSDAFATVIGWFPYLLAIAVLLFAFSTMISWSYYGVKAWGYVFGETPISIIIYKVIFCLFIIVGASVNLAPVLGFSDGMLFAMSLPNIIGCYILAPLVKKDMRSFLKRIKQGKIRV